MQASSAQTSLQPGNPQGLTQNFPDLALLELHFIATCNIQLPWYHGPLWNALFRHLIRAFVDPVRSLSELGFRVHPVETGCLGYKAKDAVHLGLSFPFALMEPVTRLIQGFNQLDKHSGRLGPATLRLRGARCLVSEHHLQADDATPRAWAVPLTARMLKEQAEHLAALQDFSLILTAPLRLKAPLAWKQKTGHTFLDPDFFQTEPSPLAWLLHAADPCLPASQTNPPPSFPVLTSEALYWQDISYGSKSTTLGGLTGQLAFSGKLSFAQALALAAAQYTGLGKNRTFGFGFFRIPELASVCPSPLRPGCSLCKRIFSVSSLQTALEKLPNSSPG